MDEYQKQVEELKKRAAEVKAHMEKTRPMRESKVKTIIALNEEQLKKLEEKYAHGEISQKEYNKQKKAVEVATKNLKSTL